MEMLDKFYNLEEEKQLRIINGAMKEFQYGYKKANTNVIVAEAGISKGLLFHYFGNKEQLFIFLLELTSKLMDEDFSKFVQGGKQDILDVFLQYTQKRYDMSQRYPYLDAFIAGLYTHWSDAPVSKALAAFEKEQVSAYEDFYDYCDESLFRADIDVRKAIDIIIFVMEGLFEEHAVDEQERFMEKVQAYLEILRKTLYQ